MKFKLNNNIDFKIVKNDYNKVFLPSAQFSNITKVKHNGIWYNCTIRFENNSLIISSLILLEKNTCRVKEHITGDIYEATVSNFLKNIILYFNNEHTVNYKIHNFKKTLITRKKTIVVFVFAILISLIYYLINTCFNNVLMTWISNSLLAQTIIMFLTLSGFINIFTPFTIQKEITKKDIETISTSKIIEQQKTEEQNKRNREQSSL
jgi:preprotein translocase subunit SecE